MDQTTPYITVGKLGKTRGLDGELYVTPLTDFPDRFTDMTSIYVDDRGTWRKWDIETARIIGKRPVLKLKGIEDPEAAARLTNKALAVTRDQVVALPEGMYYIFDLVGCRVYAENTGEQIGEVRDVKQYPANDAYEIRLNDGTDVLFPAVAQFVRQVDIENRKIVVDTAGLP